MSAQAEQEVIAAILFNPYLVRETDLAASEFRFQQYQDIFSAMRSQSDAGEPCDYVTLSHLFSGMYDSVYASELDKAMNALIEGAAGTKTFFGKYCEIIRHDHRLREAARIAETLKNEVLENKNIGAADKAISDLIALDRTGKNYSWTMEQAVKAGLHAIDEAAAHEGLIGIDTGIPELNEATGGFQKTDLFIIPARPAMGKTALLLNLANAAGVGAGIISAEQGHEQIGKRMLSIEGHCDAQRIRTATLSEDFVNQMGRAATRLINKQIFINDKPGINISEVCRQAREWVHRYGVKILFLDYLQKIKSMDERHTAKEKAAEVVSSLKNLAKELDIPVVTLAQVNREVDKRPDPRPHMGDISNAAEIEQEADLIMMLYRDEVYFPDDTDSPGIAELLIEKNRHGPTGRIRCAWIGKYMQFKPLNREQF